MVDEFAEFAKQYQGTFIRIQYAGKTGKEVVQVQACHDDEEKRKTISVRGNVSGSCILNWADSNQKFDYSFPEVGLFNHEVGMRMFYRFPDRQWKRGICSQNSQIQDPLLNLKQSYKPVSRYVPRSIAVNTPELTSAFSENYPSCLDEAVELLRSGKYEARALSPLFGISLSPAEEKSFILWKHTSMIGKVSDKRIEIRDDTFTQEVSDFLKRKQEYFWNLQ